MVLRPARSLRSRSREVDPDSGWGERAAAWVFGAYIFAAFPLLIFKLGSFFWFFRDDWAFITERQLDSLNDLFRPHAGHWSTLPVIVFRILYAIFGVRTYVPYQAAVVAVHLGVVVLLRVVMRRAGVGPWLATAAAGTLVLFGPGREDILWAFQVGFTGALLLGLGQLLLADHDGPPGRRDALALAAGLLAIMSTAPGIVMVIIVGMVMLVRRGWQMALVQTFPPAVVYGIWFLIVHPELGSPFGRPGIGAVVRWIRSGQTATFLGLGHWIAIAWVLFATMVIGMILLLLPIQSVARDRASTSRGERLRLIAPPLGLFLGSLVFMFLTAQARWIFGPDAARASRYLYVGVALTLPLLAVAAQEFARRWAGATPVLVLLLVLSMPSNVGAFDSRPFGPGYFERRRALVTTALRLPVARGVVGDVHPTADAYDTGLDLGFLRQALRDGKLDLSKGPIPPELRARLNAQLTFSQDRATTFPKSCEPIEPTQHIAGPMGTRYIFAGRISSLAVRSVQGGQPAAEWAPYDPGAGNEFTVQINKLDLEWMSVGGPGQLCRVR